MLDDLKRLHTYITLGRRPGRMLERLEAAYAALVADPSPEAWAHYDAERVKAEARWERTERHPEFHTALRERSHWLDCDVGQILDECQAEGISTPNTDNIYRARRRLKQSIHLRSLAAAIRQSNCR